MNDDQNCDAKDINEAFEDVFLAEEYYVKKGYEEGFLKGSTEDNIEAFHLGYHRGADLGAELGYYLSIVDNYLNRFETENEIFSEKTVKNLKTIQELINNFPETNVENEDILELASKIRTLFKKACALLKVNLTYPETDKLSF